jgi:hypothetical protein
VSLQKSTFRIIHPNISIYHDTKLRLQTSYSKYIVLSKMLQYLEQ